nr:nucleoside deaminase [Desulfobulbaceae bacterium]
MNEFMKKAIQLAEENIQHGLGGPFGAVIVKNNTIIAHGCNMVTSSNDPTAHAEIVAIRNACSSLNNFSLDGCTIYVNCEPCPMCLAAIYWSEIKGVYYAATRKDAADIGFADDFIYEELNKESKQRSIPLKQLMRSEALKVFKSWEEFEDKIPY